MKVEPYSGNLFLLPRGNKEAAVVTTNGMLKSTGDLVMGKGIAKYCRDEYAGIATLLGKLVKSSGNKPYFAGVYPDRNRKKAGIGADVAVISCPTKNDWRRDSDVELIKRSCKGMVAIADACRFEKIYLPALGCASGNLDWKTQVYPAIAGILDDRFIAAVDPRLL